METIWLRRFSASNHGVRRLPYCVFVWYGDSILCFASQKAFRRGRGSCFARRFAYVLLDARLGYTSFGDAGSTNNSMWHGRLLVLCPAQFPNLPIASSRGLALRFSSLEVVKLHSYEQTDALVYRQRWIPPRSPFECENPVLSIARGDGCHGRASNAGNDVIASSRHPCLLPPQVMGSGSRTIHFVPRSQKSVLS